MSIWIITKNGEMVNISILKRIIDYLTNILQKIDELIGNKLELVNVQLQVANKKLNPKSVFDEYCREVGAKFIDVESRYFRKYSRICYNDKIY